MPLVHTRLGQGSVRAGATPLVQGRDVYLSTVRGVDRVAIALPVTGTQEALAALEGAAIASYEFDAFRSTTASDSRRHAHDIVLATDVPVDSATLERARIVAEPAEPGQIRHQRPPEVGVDDQSLGHLPATPSRPTSSTAASC